MLFDFDARPALFLERPNRYLVRARLDGRVVEAHCPDPGRLRELLIPGVTIYLSRAAARPTLRPLPARKTEWDLRFVEHPQHGQLVSLDTRFPNKLADEGLRAGFFPQFGTLVEVRREAALPLAAASGPHSRIDFRLTNEAGIVWWLEVKSVTLVEEGLALFPDAVTERGRRHVSELGALAATGERAAVLFIVQRPDAHAVSAYRATDPAFADALDQARACGVLLLACTCHLSLVEMTLQRMIPVLGQPSAPA